MICMSNGKVVKGVLLVLLLSAGACKESIPDYAQREKTGEVETIEMDTAAEPEVPPVDVAALFSDLHAQFQDLEMNLTGENPEWRESLEPLENSLNELTLMLENTAPSSDKTCAAVKEIQLQIEDIYRSLEDQ